MKLEFPHDIATWSNVSIWVLYICPFLFLYDFSGLSLQCMNLGVSPNQVKNFHFLCMCFVIYLRDIHIHFVRLASTLPMFCFGRMARRLQ